MYALDFEYDGQYLSDYGFIICNLGGSSDFDVVSAGSKITFNTVARNRGKSYSLTGIQYDERITASFDICKNPDIYDDLMISNDEYRDIIRWLNRGEFLKFQLLNDEDKDHDNCYYDASFNVEKVFMNKELYGLRLAMETNKPFGYGQEQYVTWNIADVTKPRILSDMSDDVGFVYPDVTIEINRTGDIEIANELTGTVTSIKNCTLNEVITMKGTEQIVETTNKNHKIYNDFNFEFLRIGNQINNRNNKITSTLPCKLTIRYNPIIKDVPV